MIKHPSRPKRAALFILTTLALTLLLNTAFALVPLGKAGLRFAKSSEIKGKPLGLSSLVETTWRNSSQVRNDGRIIDGNEATRSQFPWQIALIITVENGNQFFCGATLISICADGSIIIVTAAHCCSAVTLGSPPKSFKIVLGAWDLSNPDGNERTIDAPGNAATVHPDFSSTTLDNDIALIIVPGQVIVPPVLPTRYIQPLRLPDSCISNPPDKTETGSNDYSGWGDDGIFFILFPRLPAKLQYGTTSPADSARKCKNNVQSYPYTAFCCSSNYFQGTCYGDSGGPMAKCNNLVLNLWGIVSFGFSSGVPTIPIPSTNYDLISDCETIADPMGFTTVCLLVDWILNTLASTGFRYYPPSPIPCT